MASTDKASTTILCIDDDPAALELTEHALRKAGYITVCVSDARAALKFIREWKPAAIVLDLLMPGLDGFEFIGRCGRMPQARGIPIVVHSLLNLPEEDLARLKGVVQGVVPKTLGDETLLAEEIRKHIEKKRPRR